MGINLDKLNTAPEQREYDARKLIIDNAIRHHELYILSEKYIQLVRPFVLSNTYVDKTRELVDHLHLGITSEEGVVHTVAAIGDCFDVIQWYIFFIHIKLQRALNGEMSIKDLPGNSEIQGDSNGSAKIALIAVERSTQAWIKLYDLIPLTEDTVLTALAILEQLKSKIPHYFRDVLQFKRPGFDEQ